MKNLELKTELCERSEALLTGAYTTRKEWNKASDQLLEIQKVWKTIGFAPKKDNNRIYERFRTACDRFFELKRDFYAGVKSEMEHNLALKQEICEQAEALQTSEDWKHATDELIALQAKWKTIGAVSRQRRWSEIGFVPIKQKESIQKQYKAVVDEMFATLRSSERDRSMTRFKDKVSGMKGDRRLRSERERLYNKVRQMEQDIALLENNIGFFAKSKNADAMIAEVRSKIERAKREMSDTIEKVRLIDRQQAQESKQEQE